MYGFPHFDARYERAIFSSWVTIRIIDLSFSNLPLNGGVGKT